MKQTILLLIAVFWMATATFSQTGTITNVQVAQRTDGSGLVDVNFTLSGSEDSYFINMRVSFDVGVNYIPISFASMSGDVGPTSPGNKHVVWNPTVDHPNRYSPQTKLKITAYKVGIANPCPGAPTVEDIDGNVYQTLLIGDQCWMASNLNTTKNPAGANITRYCFSNNTSNCELYGGLYTWTTMMNGAASSNGNPSGVQGICPTGWHLPSDAEWTELTNYLINNYLDINSDNVGNKLKSCRQVSSPLSGDCSTSTHPRWDVNSTHYGTNDFGFSGLPAGYYNPGTFGDMGEDAYVWSATQYSSISAYYRNLHSSSGSLGRSSNPQSTGFSVRCLKD